MEKLTIAEMTEIKGGKMPCWLAWSLYGVALVGLGAVTGGWAAAAAIAGYGGSIIGVIDGCTDYFDR